MPECPNCKKELSGKDLREQFSLKRYRLCPSCNHSFTVDTATKYRQAVVLELH